MFNWANSQLEKLSETLAPQPTTPTPRFIAALSSFNEQLALEILNDQNPAQQLDIYSPLKPNGLCAIHLAAQYGAIEVLKCLIFQRNVIVDTTLDSFGYTALHHASSTKQISPQQSLVVVKFLVEQCNSSVIIKSNSQSGYQTPYDVATSQAVRGYLLPKQLQAETLIEEERLKNEGSHVTQIAPPPTIMPGGMNNNMSMQGQGQSGGGMSAVDMLMQPTSGVIPAQPQANSSAHNSMPPMPPVNNNIMPPSPAAASQPQMSMMMSPQPVSSNNAVMESSPAVQQAPPNNNNASVPATNNQQQPPAKLTTSLGGMPPPPNMVSTLQSPVKVANQQPVVVAAPQQQQPSPVTTPRMEAPKSNNSTPSAPSSANNTPRAPSSGGQHSYARRGGQANTAAVLQNSKYKPDGFHSSSNDKELQAKYGHVNITSNVAPPPMSGNGSSGMPPPPNSGNSNGGISMPQPPSSGGGNPYSANPYAAPPRSTGYITSTSSSGPNRYPAYCAVSNSVSLIGGGQQHYNSAPNSSGSSGHVGGGMHQQPVVPSYATFNPAAVMNNNNATTTPSGFSTQQSAPNSGGIMPQQLQQMTAYQPSQGIQQMPPNNHAMPQTAYQSSAPVNTNMGMPPSGQMSYNASGANNNNAMQGTPQGQHQAPVSGGGFQQQPPSNVSAAASQAFDQPPNNKNQYQVANQLFDTVHSDPADKLFDNPPTEQQQVNDKDGQTTAVQVEGVNDNMPQPTSSENDQPSVVNDDQPQEVVDTDTNDTATENIEHDEIPIDGSEEISGEMQSIQL